MKYFIYLLSRKFLETVKHFFDECVTATNIFTGLHNAKTIGDVFWGTVGLIFILLWWLLIISIFVLFLVLLIFDAGWPYLFIIILASFLIGLVVSYFKWKNGELNEN